MFGLFLVALSQLVPLSFAHSGSFDSSGIILDANGSIKKFYREQALGACPSGWHLPSLRELALDCQARGAKIFADNEIDFDQMPAGFQRFKSVGADNSIDIFYLDNSGYQNPGGLISQARFWASTTEQDGEDVGYLVDGETCEVDFVYYGQTWGRPAKGSVRCFP